ncbi:LEM-3-like GIY-YIG domain-containing protein [Zhongshania aliphaticivorans]|uniref:LEM-3-like GIY-YIG domain-containing protein n=1 Tax=Zhongshania aliphaticivorans TaxID=1470434 RepID=UPI0012E42E51|nr:hypothetical protein [Zhongshania aliphaticivorans]CAA0109950.1 Uncharacterised protein [Zhongshania aliphaticivorans]
MSDSDIENFSSEVIEKLRYYVYRLIDPRNGETFYVGKGKGNRIFAHAKGDVESDALSEKMARIRAIQLAGFKVAHVIHRHNLDSSTAFEVEAALIDAYPSNTNIVDGHGSNDFGVMHAAEVVRRYAAETVVFTHKALMININRSALDSSVYEAMRFAWRINLAKAKKAEIVLAVVQGLIVGVFIADKWLPATSEHFAGHEDVEGRYGFYGKDAPDEIRSQYIDKRIPDEYRKRGAANPIKYTW